MHRIFYYFNCFTCKRYFGWISVECGHALNFLGNCKVLVFPNAIYDSVSLQGTLWSVRGLVVITRQLDVRWWGIIWTDTMTSRIMFVLSVVSDGVYVINGKALMTASPNTSSTAPTAGFNANNLLYLLTWVCPGLTLLAWWPYWKEIG